MRGRTFALNGVGVANDARDRLPDLLRNRFRRSRRDADDGRVNRVVLLDVERFFVRRLDLLFVVYQRIDVALCVVLSKRDGRGQDETEKRERQGGETLFHLESFQSLQ